MGEASHYRGWIPPEGAEESGPGLRIYNSLTDRKELFVPKNGPKSKKITWYSCGPTVYDSAHMGHSRNYVTIDILRRVLEDYFGYSILFVMNITDVDDKIVVRARRNYLLHRYQQQATDITQVSRDAHSAVAGSISKQESVVRGVQEQLKDADAARTDAETAVKRADGQERDTSASEQHRKKKARQVEDLSKALGNENHKLDQVLGVQKELKKLEADCSNGDVAAAVQRIISIAGDQIALELDKNHMAEVTDEHIFRRHAARFEREFWHDMDLLGTRRPTVLTRVTEYMPQIVDYIKTIMENRFAYAACSSDQQNSTPRDMSVYFDTVAFEQSGHVYPKLNPWAAGATALAADGESNFVTSEKRNPKDFALWKASKLGEPSWNSPWGKGRPGWHIECSAMASSIIGEKIDIHTGGEDLRFPHHDNELAQAEAFYHKKCGCRGQWVNYFMHSGHLSIDGLKMSKSLKNFISIREALKTFTARQLRLMFAMQPWSKEMTFGHTIQAEMRAKEHVFKHFFQNVDVLLRKHTPVLLMEGIEKELEEKIDEARESVHECLMDNINTAGAIETLIRLVVATNKYMKQREADRAASPSGPSPHPYLLRESAKLVTDILRVFGISTAGHDQLGFGGTGLNVSRDELLRVLRDFHHSVACSAEMNTVCAKMNVDEDCELSSSSPADVLDALTEFRTNVRDCAKKHRLNSILEECDSIRDKTMVELGIRMEDRPDGSSVWMAEDPQELQKERKEQQAAIRAANKLKQKKALDDKMRLLEKLGKQAKLPIVQKALSGKYSRFDGAGQDANPTHDADGNELSPDAKKKARAAADKARKPRAFYDKQALEKGPSYLQDMQREYDQEKREFDSMYPETEANGSM